MSEIKVNSIKGVSASTAAISIDNSSGSASANLTTVNSVTMPNDGPLSNRNKIINGDFSQDQRNDGNEVNPAVHNTYYPDRWSAHKDQADKFKIQRVSNDAPEGFKHALKCTVVNTHNPTGGNYFYLRQAIEGNNIIDLDMGKSTAKKISVSFFVKSSVTGIYSVAIRNNAYDCSAVGEYTVNSADTWERKTINFLAATSIGTWLTSNDIGIRLEFVLGAGSNYQTSTLLSFQSANKQASTNAVQWINNAGATFLITGVQLEKGASCTDYEHKSIAVEKRLCQRYYYSLKPATSAYFGAGFSYNSNVFICHIDFPVIMRANVTALEQTGTAAHYKVIRNGTTSTCSSVPTFLGDPNNTSQSVAFNFNGSLTQGEGGLGRSGNASAFLGFSAEL